MIHHRSELWLLGWGAAIVILAALYLRQRTARDATAVDAGWAFSLVAIAVLCGVLGPGGLAQRALIAAIAAWENARVGVIVIRRIGDEEDSRYRELRRRWRERGREQRTFAIFYQAQAFVAAVLALPIVLAVFYRHEGLTTLAYAGFALWIVAVAFEQVADEQLRRFKAVSANKGRTMRYGLWRYSRHPNYFFQLLTWVAYALIATDAPWGWIGWISPLFLLYLIVFVTGIPASEEAAIRSRGDEYRAYQRVTSPLIPWFPRASG